jgi:hypothetical protein
VLTYIDCKTHSRLIKKNNGKPNKKTNGVPNNPPKGLKPFAIIVAGKYEMVYALNEKNACKKERSMNLQAYYSLGETLSEYKKPSLVYTKDISGFRKAYEDGRTSILDKISCFKTKYVNGFSSAHDILYDEIASNMPLSDYAIQLLKTFV